MLVTDSSGNSIQHADVQFDVSAGGGILEDFSQAIRSSDADGKVSTVLTLGSDEDPAAQRVSTSLVSNPSLSVSFQATGKRIEAHALTTVSGVVLDNQDNPMPNVTAHLELEGTILDPAPRAVTDAQGEFTVLSAPVGHVLPKIQFSGPEVKALLSFLYALTDPFTVNLRNIIPTTAPSGLPVFD